MNQNINVPNATESDSTADNREVPEFNTDSKEATSYTKEANEGVYEMLDFDDESEKENALRGLIEAPESLIIYDENGNEVWNVEDYSFVNELETIPDTINPSLFRNTLYNSYAGLFEVCDGIYQVRGYDMANATFIKTDNGWIVFDVLMCQEDMEEAKKLMEKHFGELDIKAVLYSHSHIDHYGGIYGLINKEDAADPALSLEEQLESGKVVVIAPDGFLEHAVSENIYCGSAMGRRAQYQYGTLLKAGTHGKMAMGIGLGQSLGTRGLLPPTYDVKENETITIDGLEIQFQLTPGTEAPAEMNAYFPKYRGLWLAENCTGTMHNLYTLRGAEVRNANDWAKYILEAEQLFGDETDVVFQSHNWPHWETENIKEYMENTAAVYKYINDQTLHYINQGYTAAEISNTLKLPENLNKVWYMRQYYGTLSHNIKAVYQKYMGWYDANPVNLNPMSPEDYAKKLASYLGDADEVLIKAKEDFDKGEYQWVAEITKELIFADPTNQEARNLCADALEQLAYQSESGTWRNAYLVGALELREGNQTDKLEHFTSGASMETRSAMTPDMILDFIDIGTDALAAQDDDLTINIEFTDHDEKYYVMRKSGVLLVYKDRWEDDAECSISCTGVDLLSIVAGDTSVLENIKTEGDEETIIRLVKYMVATKQTFNIVEP
ncbi:MAG: MBL fold metallo-hydrolase [Lachnospiraceae bacterium]|nr:MBL fold metallo-hydrolase [Lachnospiraceae bacterium]